MSDTPPDPASTELDHDKLGDYRIESRYDREAENDRIRDELWERSRRRPDNPTIHQEGVP